MDESHESMLDSSIWYIRLAINVGIIGFFIYWILLFIVSLVLDARFILTSLILPGIHFVAPFTGMEMIYFYHEEWLSKSRIPDATTIKRWIAQLVIPLLSDTVALACALLTHVIELETHDMHIMAIFYALFHAMLAFSTLALVVTTFIMWRAMIARVQTLTHTKDASQTLLDGLRTVTTNI
jgi:hypothetical protein